MESGGTYGRGILVGQKLDLLNDLLYDVTTWAAEVRLSHQAFRLLPSQASIETATPTDLNDSAQLAGSFGLACCRLQPVTHERVAHRRSRHRVETPARWRRSGLGGGDFVPSRPSFSLHLPSTLKTQVERPRLLLGETREQFSHQQLHDDVVRSFLDFSLVLPTGMSQRGGDVSNPVEVRIRSNASRCSGDDTESFPNSSSKSRLYSAGSNE